MCLALQWRTEAEQIGRVHTPSLAEGLANLHTSPILYMRGKEMIIITI